MHTHTWSSHVELHTYEQHGNQHTAYKMQVNGQAGGINIEANWDQVQTVHLPCGQPLNKDALVPLVLELPLEQRPGMEHFISGVFQVQPAQPRSGRF